MENLKKKEPGAFYCKFGKRIRLFGVPAMTVKKVVYTFLD
jgi:hypothetical protein